VVINNDKSHLTKVAGPSKTDKFKINLIINDFKLNLKSLIYKCSKVSLKF